MEQWDESALREINSLDAARLAIRGALATIRHLQDQSSGLKEKLQDEGAKNKALETRLSELDARLEAWQEQAQKWEEERRQRDAMMERWKTEARLEVREEERVRSETERRQTEEVLARLRADLTAMAKAQKDKETVWTELRAMVQSRDTEIMALKREKQEVLAKVKLDAEMLEQLRQARDREISATARSRELEITDKDKELIALKRELAEHKHALEKISLDRETVVKAREDNLIKAYQLKEADLVERYQKREAELQARWSELESGLWQKTKESRAKLDESVQKQFEERARAIADRAKEVEDLLERRRNELDADHAARCAQAEEHYAAAERRLLETWSDKERKLVAKVDVEIAAEREALQAAWMDRRKALDADQAEQLRIVSSKVESNEAHLRHQQNRLLEEAARKDAERVRAQDDFISKKSAELEKAHLEKIVELEQRQRTQEEDLKRREEQRQNEYLARVSSLESEHERRRSELLEEHRKTVESEKLSLTAQFEQRQRALDEDYRARVAEQERAMKTMSEQHASFKESLRAELLRKEKEMDTRWADREAEFITRYETALADQRRSFESATSETQARIEAQRRRLNDEALAREKTMRADYEHRLAELVDSHAKEVAALTSKYDAQNSELRLVQAQVKAARAYFTDAARVKDLEARVAALDGERRYLSESLAASSQDVASLRAELLERERLAHIEAQRQFEDAQQKATEELARSLEESEGQRAKAFEARVAEIDKAYASKRRALEDAWVERSRVLDIKEQRLEEEIARRVQKSLDDRAHP